jgi:hypothetical protein
LSGGNYTLSGGFWSGMAQYPQYPNHIYLPVILRNK